MPVKKAAILLLVLALIVIGASGSSATTTNEADKTTKRIAGDWIHYKHPVALPGAKVSTINGRSPRGWAGKACDFNQTRVERSNTALGIDEVEVSREVAFNARTCSMKLETAVLKVSEARRLGFAPSAKALSELDRAADDKPGGQTLRAARSNDRYQWIAFVDAVNLPLSETTSRLKWWYSNGCIIGSQHGGTWGWLRFTGWERVARSWRFQQGSCSNETSTLLSGTFENDSFLGCDLIGHDHRINRIIGRSDGSGKFTWGIESTATAFAATSTSSVEPPDAGTVSRSTSPSPQPVTARYGSGTTSDQSAWPRRIRETRKH